MTHWPTLRRFIIALTCMGVALWAYAQEDPGGFPQLNAGNTIRGTVSGVTPNAFTIRTDEGTSYKVLYSVNSRVFLDRGPAKATDIHTGDMLIASGNLDEKAHTMGAAILIGIGAEEVRKAREGLGKTWTAGKITNVSLGDIPVITVTRPDGVTQTFAVDENTSFKHRHDSITMADIKTGDSLRADGHMSGKFFLATSIHIFSPGDRGGDPAFGGQFGGQGKPRGNDHRPTGDSQTGAPQ